LTCAATSGKQGVKTPIIMLTARGQVMDKVLGLKIGADDYLTKPFDMLELLARVEVQLRRASALSGTSAAEYRFGDVTVNFRKAEVVRAGTPLELSAREFLLLKYFIEHREATLTRDELLNEVWGITRCRPRARGRARCLAETEDRGESAAPAVCAHGARHGIQVRGLTRTKSKKAKVRSKERA
jgi:DNA-binding response OmpR family regulator